MLPADEDPLWVLQPLAKDERTERFDRPWAGAAEHDLFAREDKRVNTLSLFLLPRSLKSSYSAFLSLL